MKYLLGIFVSVYLSLDMASSQDHYIDLAKIDPLHIPHLFWVLSKEPPYLREQKTDNPFDDRRTNEIIKNSFFEYADQRFGEYTWDTLRVGYERARAQIGQFYFGNNVIHVCFAARKKTPDNVHEIYITSNSGAAGSCNRQRPNEINMSLQFANVSVAEWFFDRASVSLETRVSAQPCTRGGSYHPRIDCELYRISFYSENEELGWAWRSDAVRRGISDIYQFKRKGG